MKVVNLGNVPVLEQLRFEEALLRDDATEGNWCVFNNPRESPPGTIVLGMSGKPVKLLDVGACAEDEVQLIRRFTGGGTVFVDDGCIMVTLLVKHGDLEGVTRFPRPIMSWTEQLYNPVFEGVADKKFHLNEHDYCFEHLKFAGNAQSITRTRFLHHTSFLWSIDHTRMGRYLTLPENRPDYRKDRSHADFLTSLDTVFTHPEEFTDRVEESLKTYFHVQRVNRAEAEAALSSKEFRKSTTVLDASDYLGASDPNKR